jgi:hypothetical protein
LRRHRPVFVHVKKHDSPLLLVTLELKVVSLDRVIEARWIGCLK